MARTVITARGDQIDFDLFMIKQQLNGTPSATVAARQKFVDSKTNRRVRAALQKAKANAPQLPMTAPVVPSVPVEQKVEEPVVVPVVEEELLVDETPQEVTESTESDELTDVSVSKTAQKARKKI